MIEHNEYKVKPGVYEHYKINADGKHPVYVVENIGNWVQVHGVWTKLQDPLVIYRNLEHQFEEVNGKPTWVIKNFMRPLSEFTSTVEVNGERVPRFKQK